ncbi:IS5 family transposase, partial [Okeania sp. SIO2B9]|uniref:IS5 family transposase n=1 Tax=Okeania sp. SIO2B9 TaxID=2607782 RepID=UPI00142AEF25
IDRLRLFKMLILQKLYNLSDEQTEYQTHDRASFRRFVGLGPEEEVPDAKTLWLFHQRLTKAGLIDELFERFSTFLDEAGYAAQGGQIIDATIIPVPIQRNSKEENKQIKAGEEPPEWADNPHKQAQKDTDARWTKKNKTSYFGYKDHINIDATYRFIRVHTVTDASVHDSKMFAQVLDEQNPSDEIWADSAYYSVNMEATLALLGYISHIHERGYRNHPLNEEQKASNREKSKTRARVEHVFGHWVTSMGGKLVRCIGLKRVQAHQGLKALSYNLSRYVFLQKQASVA